LPECRHNEADVRAARGSQPLATLWRLAWNGDNLACIVYRCSDGRLQLRVEVAETVIVDERFELQPRMMARARALREALKRRGWQEV
jgi:hypothetical protein